MKYLAPSLIRAGPKRFWLSKSPAWPSESIGFFGDLIQPLEAGLGSTPNNGTHISKAADAPASLHRQRSVMRDVDSVAGHLMQSAHTRLDLASRRLSSHLLPLRVDRRSVGWLRNTLLVS